MSVPLTILSVVCGGADFSDQATFLIEERGGPPISFSDNNLSPLRQKRRVLG